MTKPERHEGFIQSDDIGYDANGGKTVTLTIDRVAEPGTVKDSMGKVVENEVVYFTKAKKGLILNATNRRVIKLIHGPNPTEWTGKPVTLSVKFINAFGERDVPTIRVQPPEGIPLPFGVRKWKGADKPAAKSLRELK